MHTELSGILETDATLAQLVEHLIRNEKVASSILAGGSMSDLFNHA